MKLRALRPVLLVCALPVYLGVNSSVFASDSIETAGDILQLVLPATAAGLTLGYRDGPGALQFGESAGVTLGVTYALKYTVNETRPDGGTHSFPSAHTSISFSAAEFMRKRYGWEYGIPVYAAASFVAYSRVEKALCFGSVPAALTQIFTRLAANPMMDLLRLMPC